MAFRYNDRVRVNVIPSGTGDISLGTVPTGYLSFADGGFSNGDTTVICCIVPATGEFIVCEATYNSAGPSITRGTIIESSNSGANVNFAGGTSGALFVGLSATRVLHKDMTSAELIAAGIRPAPTTQEITATGTVQGDAAVITGDDVYIIAGGANTGVVLRGTSDDPIGTIRTVVDKTGTIKKLWPDSGSQIDSIATDTALELAPYQSIRVKRKSATVWYAS